MRSTRCAPVGSASELVCQCLSQRIRGCISRIRVDSLRRLVWRAALVGVIALSGCAVHSSGRVYSSAADGTDYVVKRGDTLYSIAWRKGLDYQTVAAWNRIRSPYIIYVGQRIHLRPPDLAATGTDADPGHRAAQPRPSARQRIESRPQSTASQQPRSESADAVMPRWQWPANGPLLRRFDADANGKKGISIGGTHGTPVRAAAAGQVVYAGSGLVGYGRLIIVKHNDVYLSAYGHNRHLLVNEGDAVRSGQVIAEMGSSGTNHIQLHFEIRRKGKPVDPLRYLPRR